MTLAVHFDGNIRHLADHEEATAVFDEMLESGEDWASATWLTFDASGATDPLSFLEVSANPNNGYGGVVWFAGGREADRIENETGSDMGHFFWVSDSDSPPSVDPEVLSDPHTPSYFDVRGVLPVVKIREIVDEYCQLAGGRPAGIRWVPGNQNGTRLD